MKTRLMFLGALAMGVIVGGFPVYAAMEGSVSVGPQSLSDFQRFYSGTKPVVASARYQEAKYLEKLPRPTLSVIHLRSEDIAKGTGTKPGIQTKHGSAHSWTLGTVTPSKPSIRRA